MEPMTVTRQRVIDDALHVRHDFMIRRLSAQYRFRDVIFVGSVSQLIHLWVEWITMFVFLNPQPFGGRDGYESNARKR